MSKKVIKLTEENLRKCVKESVKKILTENYRMDSLDELLEYMWLRPNETNLNVDIFVDDGSSYIRHGHKLLLFVRNGYDKNVNEFIPFSISNNPTILDDDIILNISYNDIFSVQNFIVTNLTLLQRLADREISQTSFVDLIKPSLSAVCESKELLSEMATLRKEDGKRSISVNDDNTNPKYVDTNNHASPYIFKDTQRGYTVYSIFQRQKTEDDSTDANPILNALKQKKGWEFENAKIDLMKLLRNFVAAVKLLPKYDTIIMTPSNNDLNKIVFSYLIRLIPHANSYENFFEKYTAEDVYNNLIDDAYINKHFENPQKVYNSIDEAFGNMMKNNNGIFSYRCLLKTPYREAIIQSMKVNLGVDNDLNYDEAINGKNVLIFDDTVTTGKTISDSGRAIYEMFAPNTLTYVTLFSALNTHDGTQEKIQKV